MNESLDEQLPRFELPTQYPSDLDVREGRGFMHVRLGEPSPTKQPFSLTSFVEMLSKPGIWLLETNSGTLRPLPLLPEFTFNIPEPTPDYYPDWLREMIENPASPALTTPRPSEEPPFWTKGPAGATRRGDQPSGKHAAPIRRNRSGTK